MSIFATIIWFTIGCTILFVLLHVFAYGRFFPKSRRAISGLILMSVLCLVLIVEAAVLSTNPIKYRNIGSLAIATAPFIYIVDNWMVVRQNYPLSRPLLIGLTVLMSILVVVLLVNMALGKN